MHLGIGSEGVEGSIVVWIVGVRHLGLGMVLRVVVATGTRVVVRVLG